MSKRIPPKLEQEIIALRRTKGYTDRQLSQKFALPRSTIWGIVQGQNSYQSINPRPKPSKLEIATVVRNVDWNENELDRVWNLMKQILKKKFGAINGKTYGLD